QRESRRRGRVRGEDLLRRQRNDRYYVETPGARARPAADRAMGIEARRFRDADAASPLERGRSGSIRRHIGSIDGNQRQDPDHFPHSPENEKDGGTVRVRRLLFNDREASRFVDHRSTWLSRTSPLELECQDGYYRQWWSAGRGDCSRGSLHYASQQYRATHYLRG